MSLRSLFLAISACLIPAPSFAQHAFFPEGAFGGGHGDLSARIRASRAAAAKEPLVTDRPDFTEASSVVGLGVVQLETGYTHIYRDDEFDQSITHSHSFPEVLLRIGIHEGAELRIISSYLWQENIDAGVRSTPEGGLPLGLGFKFQLLRNEGWVPETALISGITLETGAKEFRTEDTDFNMVLLYSWELPCGWTLGGNSGFTTFTEDIPVLPATTDRDGHVILFQSIAMGRSVTDSIGMYIEYFGLYTAGRRENFPANFIDGGFTYLLNNDVQFDIRAGKGLNNHADDLFTGVGMSLRF